MPTKPPPEQETPEDVINRTVLAGYVPTVVPDWKLRLKRAWSPRFMALLGVSQALNAVWPNLGGVIDPPIFNAVSCVLALLALAAIFTKQEGFHYGKS